MRDRLAALVDDLDPTITAAEGDLFVELNGVNATLSVWHVDGSDLLVEIGVETRTLTVDVEIGPNGLVAVDLDTPDGTNPQLALMNVLMTLAADPRVRELVESVREESEVADDE